MKKSKPLAVPAWGFALGLLATGIALANNTVPGEFFALTGASAETCFSPDNGCTGVIVRQINEARDRVLMQAYPFTPAPIAQALVSAARRGSSVTVILDENQSGDKPSPAQWLKNSGVNVYIDSRRAAPRDKVILIDGNTVITGSFNFTRAAEEKDSQTLLIVSGSRRLFSNYYGNFEERLKHSDVF